VTPAELRRLRDDLSRGYDAVIRERFGKLTERQKRLLEEIRQAVNLASDAIDAYAAVAENPRSKWLSDPRYRLMYAARTPLEMVLLGVYLINVYHVREIEPLNPDQHEAIALMERSGRRMVIEIERLWNEMQTEQMVKP
jgi:hypothetical protein